MSENQVTSSASDTSVGAPSPEPSTATTIADQSMTTTATGAKKRGSTDDSAAAQKITKRRAARACVSCRARKVRCDVVEGAPCGNCRWDNVEVCAQLIWDTFFHNANLILLFLVHRSGKPSAQVS
jgi:hypothetical protein